MPTSIDNLPEGWLTPSPDSIELEIDYSSWKRPPGLIGDIADFIYSASPSPLIEVAIAAALAVFAGLVARAYNVRGMGLNLYIIALAPSGSGKNGGKIGIERLYAALKLILANLMQKQSLVNPLEIRKGVGFLVSPQGLRNSIAGNSKTPSRMCSLSVFGEFGLYLQELCDAKRSNANLKGLRRLILDLYTASGGATTIGDTVYSDADKNVCELVAPAWSFFGDSTQLNFFKALSEDSVGEGLVPRFSPIEFPVGVNYPEPNPRCHEAQPSPALLNALAGIMRRVAEVEHTADTLKLYNWIDVPLDVDAHRFDDGLEKDIRQKMQSLGTGNQTYLVELWSRFREKLLRVAALLAVGVNPDNPVITLDEMVWAHRFTLHGTELILARFESGKVGQHNEQNEQYEMMGKAINSYLSKPWSQQFERSYLVSQQQKDQHIIHYQYLNANLRTRPAFKNATNTKFAIDNTIKQFEDAGVLLPIALNNGNAELRGRRTGKMFFIVRKV